MTHPIVADLFRAKLKKICDVSAVSGPSKLLAIFFVASSLFLLAKVYIT